MKEGVWKSFIVLLTNAPELHAYAARALFRALRQHVETAQTSLLATATWYTGGALQYMSAYGYTVSEPVGTCFLKAALRYARAVFQACILACRSDIARWSIPVCFKSLPGMRAAAFCNMDMCR